MPINVFGKTSNSSENRIDTSIFVQKPYLRTNYIQSNLEEDIDFKNQYRIKISPHPISIQEAASKNYVDNKVNNLTILKNTSPIDLNDRNITNAIFIQVNQLPQIDSQLTAKLYVDNAIDEFSLVRSNQGNDFNNHNLTNIKSITLNTEAVNDDQVITKAYVDQFHQENEQSRRDLGLDFYNESSDIVKNNQYSDLNDNKLKNLDSIAVIRNPSEDNEVSNKGYVDDSVGEGTIVRFNQTLENYLKVSVGNDTYNLTKYDKIQIIDITFIIKSKSKTGGYVLPPWNVYCIVKNGNGKTSNFIKATESSSSTAHSGATALPSVGKSFMFIETSSNIQGNIVFVSFERTDIIQITNKTFY